MHFNIKNYLKTNRYHTVNHLLEGQKTIYEKGLKNKKLFTRKN
jgi:hypothetical protein